MSGPSQQDTTIYRMFRAMARAGTLLTLGLAAATGYAAYDTVSDRQDAYNAVKELSIAPITSPMDVRANLAELRGTLEGRLDEGPKQRAQSLLTDLHAKVDEGADLNEIRATVMTSIGPLANDVQYNGTMIYIAMGGFLGTIAAGGMTMALRALRDGTRDELYANSPQAQRRT